MQRALPSARAVTLGNESCSECSFPLGSSPIATLRACGEFEWRFLKLAQGDLQVPANLTESLPRSELGTQRQANRRMGSQDRCKAPQHGLVLGHEFLGGFV